MISNLIEAIILFLLGVFDATIWIHNVLLVLNFNH